MEMLYYTVDIFSLHIHNYVQLLIKMTESVNVFVLYNLCCSFKNCLKHHHFHSYLPYGFLQFLAVCRQNKRLHQEPCAFSILLMPLVSNYFSEGDDNPE